MDALQVIYSETQLVSSIVGAVVARDQASRDLDEAPKNQNPSNYHKNK